MGLRGPKAGMATTTETMLLAKDILDEWPAGGILKRLIFAEEDKDEQLMAYIKQSQEPLNIQKYGSTHCERAAILCALILPMSIWQRKTFWHKLHGTKIGRWYE